MVRSDDYSVSWLDLTAGSEKQLGKTQIDSVLKSAYNPRLELLAISGFTEPITVYDLKHDTRFSLPPPPEQDDSFLVRIVWDPLDRWMFTYHSGVTRAWNLPFDPLFGEMDYEECLEALKAKTNLRVTPDESQPNGFLITNTLEMEQ